MCFFKPQRPLVWKNGETNQRLTLKTCRPSLTTWLASNTNLPGQRGNHQLTHQQQSARQRAEWIKSEWVTRKDKDKAGSQSSNQRYDPTDVWDEEGEEEGGHEPHQRLHDAPPALAPDAHLHLLALETQPQSLDDGPAGSDGLEVKMHRLRQRTNGQQCGRQTCRRSVKWGRRWRRRGL